ncbi:hypothetical protein, partial [Malikia granosa]|uniref:hypothetical protein n=1 Tax=Malikia granosa TaxID=263067 RepID=UPI001B800DF1
QGDDGDGVTALKNCHGVAFLSSQLPRKPGPVCAAESVARILEYSNLFDNYKTCLHTVKQY